MKPKENTASVENSRNGKYVQGPSQHSPTPSQPTQSSIAIENQTPQERVSYLHCLEWFSFEWRKFNDFAVFALDDWFKISRLFFIQSEVKTKPIVIRSHTFSRALRQLHVINFDWFAVLSDYFGFVLKTALKSLHLYLFWFILLE